MRLRFFAVLAALVLICGVMAACAKKPETPAEFLSLGEKYLIELDYEQAVVQFLKAIEIEPMNARAYTLAAEAYIGLGQTDKAVEVLERGLQALPEDTELARMLETLYLEPEVEQDILNEFTLETEQGFFPTGYNLTSEQEEMLRQLRDALKNHDYWSVYDIQSSADYRKLTYDNLQLDGSFVWGEDENQMTLFGNAANMYGFTAIIGEWENGEHISASRGYEDDEPESILNDFHMYAYHINDGLAVGEYVHIQIASWRPEIAIVEKGNAASGYAHGEVYIEEWERDDLLSERFLEIYEYGKLVPQSIRSDKYIVYRTKIYPQGNWYDISWLADDDWFWSRIHYLHISLGARERLNLNGSDEEIRTQLINNLAQD